MKKRYISQIKEKEKISDVFLVTKKETGTSKVGKRYLNLRLMDRTGTVEGRVWDNVDRLAARFSKDDFIKIRGHAISYQSSIQINITDLSKIQEEEVDLSDFLPSSKEDPDTMMERLNHIIDSLGNSYLRGLLGLLFEDEETTKRFKRAPAAKVIHHNYLGGLLEHVLSLCGLVQRVASNYDGINIDLLVTGAILHDIGKIYELSFERSFNYTDEGRLLGHISIGAALIDRTILQIPDFPEKLAMLLKHMLLSHHGRLEFGSPKRPKTIEATILYYCDDLDSKMRSIMDQVQRERDTDSNWTTYNRAYERYLYKGDNLADRGNQDKDVLSNIEDTGPAKQP